MGAVQSTTKFFIACCLVLLAACDQRMDTQPKYEALEAAPVFTNNQAARWPPAGTIATDAPLRPGQAPAHMTQADIERGAERYRIYCEPCHGVLGNGQGLVVQRGFPSPPSYHTERLRKAGLPYFFDVMTNGYGVMYSYADRVPPADRWRIAFYIQALQQSQYTDLQEYPQFRDEVEQAEDTGTGTAQTRKDVTTSGKKTGADH